MKLLTNLDFSQNELQNAVLQPLAAAPGNPKLGQLYYDSTLLSLCQWNGSEWKRIPAASDIAPQMNGTASAGSQNSFARADHVHPGDTAKVDKVTGMGLSENDLSDALKGQYDSAYQHSQASHAPADAEKNVQADWNVTDTGSDAFIKNKPSIPKSVTRTVQTLTGTSGTYTVSGYILNVLLIDSVTKEEIIGNLLYPTVTDSANSQVTVSLSQTPAHAVLVVITSLAL